MFCHDPHVHAAYAGPLSDIGRRFGQELRTVHSICPVSHLLPAVVDRNLSRRPPGNASPACGSGSPRPPRTLSGRGGSWKTPALCHELSCSPCRRRSSAVPFLHIAPSVAFRSAPLPPPRRRPGRRRAAGPFFARVSCVRARACPRALAPARFAHLIARARRRAHLAPPFPPGLFSAPALASLRRNRDRGEPHGSTPPTPPCIRVRTRRFDGFKLRNGLAGRRGRACRRQPPGVRGRHAPYGLRSLGLRRSGLHPSPPAPRPVPTGCSAAWSA